ncbi:MAG: anaerobic glycerol-3-phosphate dehydrogenase subunit B [Bacteroidales bacterium]|nr:anaerobic glycerol-3-phosphate dehydrogenase subunit B [Bacteroidales bacterium]
MIRRTVMQFDVAITGGGLSGLLCGINLQAGGRKVVIVSSGESSLIMSSGSFELLGKAGGKRVENPLDSLGELPAEHPYNIIGKEAMTVICQKLPDLLGDCGISVRGSAEKNMLRLTPVGRFKPCWLALDSLFTTDGFSDLPSSVLIAQPEGFMDADSSFMAEALEKKGVSCRIASICFDELSTLRGNASEFRAVAIARQSDSTTFLDKVAASLTSSLKGEKLVLVPAAFGLRNDHAMKYLSVKTDVSVLSYPTLPPSAPGVAMASKLRCAFEGLGGTFINGDTVESADIEDGLVKAIYTEKLGSDPIVATDYVLASGSFLGRGLRSDMNHIYEPVFGADVVAADSRQQWYSPDFFAAQAYQGFGVASDSSFRLSVDGATVANLYGAGMVLAGADVIEEQSKEGVEIATACAVADNILKK